MTFSPKVAYITGGGTGIGKALAEAFHKRGIQVVIGGRRAHKLEAVCDANPGMKHVTVDVSDPKSVQEAWGRVVDMFPEVDCIVNNAGLQKAADFGADEPLDATLGDVEIDTNFRSVIVSAVTVLPHLKAQPQATIINVSSCLANVPLARNPVYCATKAAVRSFTQTLRYQLRKTNVRVIELQPPAVQTDLHDYMGAHGKQVGIPIDEFVKGAMEGLDSGASEFAVGDLGRNSRGTINREKFDQVFNTMNPPDKEE